jgi:CBS domain-containing protein
VVVNDKRIVLGRLGQSALNADPEAVAETVMEPGPITIRPNSSYEAILRRMQKGNLDSLIVTTSDGELVGVLNRRDIEERRGHPTAEEELTTVASQADASARQYTEGS